jgi:uncharacterized protein (DUF2164 family)
MREEFEKKIFEKYGYMFESEEMRNDPMKSCLYWGFECGNGWEKLIENLCEELDIYLKKNPQNFQVVQVKSKFGMLCFYNNGIDDEGYKIISKYVDLSERTCEFCGKDGASPTGKHWITTLCPDCVKANPQFS